MFNSLKAVKRLEEAGFTRLQAETLVQITIEIFEELLASKSS
jgi:hypothetical protein